MEQVWQGRPLDLDSAIEVKFELFHYSSVLYDVDIEVSACVLTPQFSLCYARA